MWSLGESRVSGTYSDPGGWSPGDLRVDAKRLRRMVEVSPPGSCPRIGSQVGLISV